MPDPTPTRRTAEVTLDRWNDAFRQSEVYLNFMRRNGLPTNGRVKLSRSQQSALESDMRRAGIQIPSGMHIDQGGNLNQKNTLVRNVGIGAAIGGGALTGLGLAGIGPFSGLAGGGASASGAAGGVLPSSHLPVEALMGGAPAIASQGVSAGIPYAAGVGGAVAAGAARGAAGAAGEAGGRSLLDGVKDALKDPKNYAALAGLLPFLMNSGLFGGDGDDARFGGPVDKEIADTLALQRKRLEQTQPALDTLVNMSYGMSPTRYRGAPPAGYTPNEAPAGPYKYESPRFG